MAAADNTRISGPVGRGGVNRMNDVITVQHLINNHLPTPLRPLNVDGRCGLLTIGAIEEIQRRYLRMEPPDGRVDPNGATLRLLARSAPKPHVKPPSHLKSHAFPAEVIAAAQASHEAWAVPASVTLAQWALESNWGRHMPRGSNNPFGIKARKGQPYVAATTHEVIHGQTITVIAHFRKFDSLDEAFDQHGKLLATAPAYARARAVVRDPNAFADALTGVYATDPNYGTSLKRVMKDYNLYQYD